MGIRNIGAVGRRYVAVRRYIGALGKRYIGVVGIIYMYREAGLRLSGAVEGDMSG